jgi:hypothetical protein
MLGQDQPAAAGSQPADPLLPGGGKQRGPSNSTLDKAAAPKSHWLVGTMYLLAVL